MAGSSIATPREARLRVSDWLDQTETDCLSRPRSPTCSDPAIRERVRATLERVREEEGRSPGKPRLAPPLKLLEKN